MFCFPVGTHMSRHLAWSRSRSNLGRYFQTWVTLENAILTSSSLSKGSFRNCCCSIWKWLVKLAVGVLTCSSLNAINSCILLTICSLIGHLLCWLTLVRLSMRWTRASLHQSTTSPDEFWLMEWTWFSTQVSWRVVTARTTVRWLLVLHFPWQRE